MRSPAHCTSCCASVGAGFSCPPSCQPIPGHCRVRQSGHFLETGSLHPPPAALRRFPRPPGGAEPLPYASLERFRRGDPCGRPPIAPLVTLCRGGRLCPPVRAYTAFLVMCHCEPVTDVTGVAIRSPRPLRWGITDSHDQSADWSRNDTQILSTSVIARAQRARGNPSPLPLGPLA